MQKASNLRLANRHLKISRVLLFPHGADGTQRDPAGCVPTALSLESLALADCNRLPYRANALDDLTHTLRVLPTYIVGIDVDCDIHSSPYKVVEVEDAILRLRPVNGETYANAVVNPPVVGVHKSELVQVGKFRL